jgi:ABC-type antimicrobial peptide transport system permease subunit
MMFKRISLIASLLFFLLGTNALANSNVDHSSKYEKNVISHTIVNKDSHKTVKAVPAASLDGATTELTWKNYIVPVSVCVFIIIIFGGYWFILRKRLFSGN